MSLKLIPAGSSKWLVEQMKCQGIEIHRMLANTKLNESWLNQEDAMITHAQYCQIVNNAYDTSGNSALGLTISEKTDLNWHGFWGYAIISSPTWIQAMQFIIKFWELNGALVDLIYTEENDISTIDILPAFPLKQPQLLRYAVEEWLRNASFAYQFTTGLSIKKKKICLAYPEPEYGALYQEIFDCPIEFDCSANQLIAPVEIVNVPILTANPQIAEFCIQQCESMLQGLDRSDSLIESIRQLLIVTPGQFPKFDEVAVKLGISQRTLSRRLQDRKTTYKIIVNEIRSSLAKEYLEKTDLSIDQIANLVGFAETASFRRFYKKEMGISAADIRKTP